MKMSSGQAVKPAPQLHAIVQMQAPAGRIGWFRYGGAARVALAAVLGNRPVPSRQDKAMTAPLTREGTHAPATKPTSPDGRGRIRNAFRRIHLTIQEMNYASRCVVELQAPWIVDEQWHRR